MGKSSYTVTFPKGGLPPVKGFWSLTVYDPEHFFYPNPLKRYALGTKNKSLKYNDDGSLTVYLGNRSPGQEEESNWIPSPAGSFSIWLHGGPGVSFRFSVGFVPYVPGEISDPVVISLSK